MARADVLTVVAGRRHTLLIRSDGTVWAWGEGRDGRLGNGGTVVSATPVQAMGVAGAVGVSGGAAHSLAVTGTGTVWAWGGDSFGQVGDGATSGMVTTPVRVAGLPTIRAVVAGAEHSLALATDGTVWAWGSNTWNALGNNGPATQGTPSQVAGLSGVVAIAAGGSISMALKGDKTVWVWGSNTNGQLGDGDASTNYQGHPAPQQVPNLGGVMAITAAFGHLHALKSDGTVWGWGANGEAEQGLGSVSNTGCDCIKVPTQTPGVSGVIAISAGDFHTLALKSDAEDQTSVANGVNGANQPAALSPVQIPNLGNVTAVAGAGCTASSCGASPCRASRMCRRTTGRTTRLPSSRSAGSPPAAMWGCIARSGA